jgi:hypothetical protein
VQCRLVAATCVGRRMLGDHFQLSDTTSGPVQCCRCVSSACCLVCAVAHSLLITHHLPPQRFRHVAADRRLALTVAACSPASPGEHTSLKSAVDTSLPGQTVYLEPGRHHAQNVAIRCAAFIKVPPSCGAHSTFVVRHPLRIVATEHCLLVVPRGSLCGLAVHANCRLHGVTVLTLHTGTCVEHHAGKLHLESCALRCSDANPSFVHLSCPITSLARTAASSLSVVNTSLDGGHAAVKCVGTGVVSSARVIMFSRSATLWFEVIATEAPADATPVLVEKIKEERCEESMTELVCEP